MFFRRKLHHAETALEEVFNALTHGLGMLFGIIALVIMVSLSVLHGSPLKVVTTAVYGATIVFMFTASTLYHAFPWKKTKAVFKVLDHSSIYLLIAGSYTPVVLVKMGGPWGWSMFGIIWGLTVFGIIFKLFFTGRFEVFSLALYGIMGWLIVIALDPLMASMPTGGLAWLLAGGALYTLGVIFYVLDTRYHFAHFLWHLFVLAGCICHFFAILLYVIY